MYDERDGEGNTGQRAVTESRDDELGRTSKTLLITIMAIRFLFNYSMNLKNKFIRRLEKTIGDGVIYYQEKIFFFGGGRGRGR